LGMCSGFVVCRPRSWLRTCDVTRTDHRDTRSASSFAISTNSRNGAERRATLGK
jgi:hypothetical protein